MTISIWRYSHLTLAISSSLFILLAAITGIILAFEPISNQLEPYAIHNLETQSLSKTVGVLDNRYAEVISLKIDDNHFVEASVVTKNGDSETFYIDPFTGDKIATIIDKKPFYTWTTNLHRSLFLKSTGRFLAALFSLLLALITITGSILILKRQGGIKRVFSKVVKENFEQYYHIIIGRITFIPIIIISLTGVYLSLEKFSIVPNSKITHTYNYTETSTIKKILPTEFPLFKSIKLSDVKLLEFPFSEDEEDYFFLKTQNKEYIIHQYSGKPISNQNLSTLTILSNWSLLLHTGRGSIAWSLLLLFSCFAILFFMYSGVAISLKRRQQNGLLKNTFHKDKAEFVILVGSETGSTNLFANSLYLALLAAKKSVYIHHLNNYTTYNKLKSLLILTSTYGHGEPPVNGANFLKKLTESKLNTPANYAVVGFGSLAYAHYCQFAIQIDEALKNHTDYTSMLALCKINNQSFADFKTWGIQFSKKNNTELHLKQRVQKIKNQQDFTVVETTALNKDNTYLIRLKPSKKTKFTSGDLLAIRPPEDHIERLYSIGKIDNDIVLSIKKHAYGVCSNALLNLKNKEQLKAKIHSNKAFQLPKKKQAILIANGTGIAPFLGMINERHPNTHLFFGLKTNASLNLYTPHLKNIDKQHMHIAYSQENHEYVQDLIAKKEALIASTLKNKGTIMICGSVGMMHGVLTVLEKITLQRLNKPLHTFKKTKQIKTDCY